VTPCPGKAMRKYNIFITRENPGAAEGLRSCPIFIAGTHRLPHQEKNPLKGWAATQPFKEIFLCSGLRHPHEEKNPDF
jgi:hypothetical protein